MVVTTIYVTRHAVRGNFTLNPISGQYSTTTPSPTGIPTDPELAAYGCLQADQLATALLAIDSPPVTHVYCSPYYRCLQTIRPFVEKKKLQVKGDNGIGEWFGQAPFEHPSPATPSVLQALFPFYDLNYEPSIIPSPFGESPAQLHTRIANGLQHIIQDADAQDAARSEKARQLDGKDRTPDEEETGILICSHAAPLIAIGRTLTGSMPDDVCEVDFKTFTCGISKFQRRATGGRSLILGDGRGGADDPKVDWKGGKGVAGGWDCVINSNCSHLSGGEERGWHFQSDEVFDGFVERSTDTKL